MKYTKLGHTGEQLSAIGLGCMGMSFAYGPSSEKESIATLEKALDLGVNFWDTADMYANGENEKLISKVLAPNRKKVFIATKFGFRFRDGVAGHSNSPNTYFDGSPEWIKKAVDLSLQSHLKRPDSYRQLILHFGCFFLLMAMAPPGRAKEVTRLKPIGHPTSSWTAAGLDAWRAADTVKPDARSRKLAPAPPMGWNSWNWFGKTQINEQIVREVIDAMVSSGLRDAGYRYLIIDGGWRDTMLEADGGLRPNPERFPHGIKVLADYAHTNGLKFGLHTVPGSMDCGGDPVGGYGHEEIQIRQFVDWGVDFLKLDKCRMHDRWDETVLRQTYQKWHDMLARSGRDIILSISAYQFRDWNPAISQMSRTTRDIGSRTNGGARFDTFEIKKWGSVMGNAETNSRSADAAGPGYWNDPDMLVVGSQGLTVAEQQVHFALWCVMSSPLFLGNDPRHMGTDEKSILLNKTCIRIDQDPAGQGRRVWKDGDTEAWTKKMTTGEVAILLINRSTVATHGLAVPLADLGVGAGAGLTDVYSGKKLKTSGNHFSGKLAPQSGLFILAKPR